MHLLLVHNCKSRTEYYINEIKSELEKMKQLIDQHNIQPNDKDQQ